MTPGLLAVALHDIEPRSFARTQEIRDWLRLRGGRARHPARDPSGRSPPDRIQGPPHSHRGDEPASRKATPSPSTGWCTRPRPRLGGRGACWRTGRAARPPSSPGLGLEDTARRVDTGRRLLREIELDPQGFVAPGYAYTRNLRRLLADTFEWFADLRCIRRRSGKPLQARALCLGTSTQLKRTLSPPLISAASRAPAQIMRVDIHPADFDHRGHVQTLEMLLTRANGRRAVTYDELLA